MNAHRSLGQRLRGFAIIAAGIGLLAGPASAAQNTAPTISGSPGTAAVVGQEYAFQPSASDADGDRLMFNASGVPNWARFDKKTGRLWGTPPPRYVDNAYPITISVSDGKLSASLAPFTITISGGNPPVIGGVAPAGVTEGELYVFEPSVSDPDGDALKFGIANKPAWASFSNSTGLLSGIPPVGSAGTYSNVSIAVSDGTNSATLPQFDITVKSKGNSAPAIWGVPATAVDAGQSYSFVPSASDPDGQTLQFAVQGLPSWARFSTSTGSLSGTPAWSDAGRYSNIVVSVTDGLATTSLAPFTISVSAPNTPPTISGTPADSVTAGQAYAFAPTATDPEGQALTFSIANKPAWAAFDASSGRLSGTPTNEQAATYSNIVVSVSDGQYSAQLPAFSITVLAKVAGSATLSWAAPTTNEDGTPVTDLAGYRVVYGQSAAELSQSLTIGSAAITSAVIEGLTQGTWYFAVKAYTSANVESNLSTVASKTIY